MGRKCRRLFKKKNACSTRWVSEAWMDGCFRNETGFCRRWRWKTRKVAVSVRGVIWLFFLLRFIDEVRTPIVCMDNSSIVGLWDDFKYDYKIEYCIRTIHSSDPGVLTAPSRLFIELLLRTRLFTEMLLCTSSCTIYLEEV